MEPKLALSSDPPASATECWSNKHEPPHPVSFLVRQLGGTVASPELPQESSAVLMTSGDKSRSRGLPVGPPGARWVRVKAQSGVRRAAYI